MPKPKLNHSCKPTPNEVADQAVCLLLQSAQMIDDLIAVPTLCDKPMLKKQVEKIREKARWLSKFVQR